MKPPYVMLPAGEFGDRPAGAQLQNPIGNVSLLKLDKNLLKSKYITITFKHRDRVYEVTGRPAQTLAWLSYASNNGITAAEVSSWAYRLGAYVHTLRRKYFLDIETKHEIHDGGWHARYILISVVEIIRLEAL